MIFLENFIGDRYFIVMSNEKITIEISDWSKLNMDPLVSVYMLAYRHEKFIAQAIEGVLAQKTNFPIELIIGEDCSPDHTRDIILTYQARYPHIIRVLTSEKNVGAYANSKRCRLAARGKYIAICEGDDYWHHPNKLQMQIDLLESDNEMMLCHTDFDRLTRFRCHHNIHNKNALYYKPSVGYAYQQLLVNWAVITATCVYRANVVFEFMKSHYYTEKWPFGDYNLALFASLKGRLGYIDISTATYRKTGGSATKRGFDANLQMEIATLECVELFIQSNPIDKEVEKNVIVALMKRIYLAAYFAGNQRIMNDYVLLLRKNGVFQNRFIHNVSLIAVKLGVPYKIHRWLKYCLTSRFSEVRN